MKKLILGCFLAVTLTTGGLLKVHAGLEKTCWTDGICMAECLAKNHAYGYCKKLCSY